MPGATADEDVVPISAQENVRALAADQDVVTAASHETIAALTAVDRVVAAETEYERTAIPSCDVVVAGRSHDDLGEQHSGALGGRDRNDGRRHPDDRERSRRDPQPGCARGCGNGEGGDGDQDEDGTRHDLGLRAQWRPGLTPATNEVERREPPGADRQGKRVPDDHDQAPDTG